MTYYLPLPPQAYLNQPTFIEYRVTVPVSVIGDVDPGLRKKLMHPEVPNPFYYIPNELDKN